MKKMNILKSVKFSKKFFLPFIILAWLVALGTSCENQKVKIPVKNLTFEFDDIKVDEATKDVLNSFNVTQVINLSTLKGLSEDALKYKSKVTVVETGTTSITIYSVDDVGTIVKEFVLHTSGVGTFNVPHYDLGTPHIDNVQDYAANLLLKLMLNNTATVNISGKTDIPSGKNLRVAITLEDVTLFANILN